MIYFYLCCLLIFFIFFNIDIKEGLTKKSKMADDNNVNDSKSNNVNVNDCGGVDSLNAKLQTANTMMDNIISQGKQLTAMLSSDTSSGIGSHSSKRKHKRKHKR
jgi:hypothetical protein